MLLIIMYLSSHHTLSKNKSLTLARNHVSESKDDPGTLQET